MKVNGTKLNNFQSNFLKELMGDIFMPDVRAEATLSRLTRKYDIDETALVEAVNKNFVLKNTEFKRVEAEAAKV